MIHNPKLPGLMINSLLLEPLGISASTAAKLLKISRPPLSKILNGHLGISPEMAIRLSTVFNTSEELWINLQTAYDLWKVQKTRAKLKLTLQPFIGRI